MWHNNVDVAEMLGQTFTSVQMSHDREEVVFANDTVKYTLYHEQDCCESVSVEEIAGDLSDLENWPLLVSYESSNIDDDFDPAITSGEESFTWTFYNFATYKGYVTVRFLGTSNGYYSESVYCRKELINN